MVFVPFLCLFAVLALFLVRLGDHLAHVGTIGHKHAHTHTRIALLRGDQAWKQKVDARSAGLKNSFVEMDIDGPCSFDELFFIVSLNWHVQ